MKDSHYLKLVHRDNHSSEFDLGQTACFSEPPRFLEDRVTLQILYQLLPSFFELMDWQSMLKDNHGNSHYLGFVKKVFEGMKKYSRFVQRPEQKSFVQFQVKLFDMKYFLESATQYVTAALKRQQRELSTCTEKMPRGVRSPRGLQLPLGLKFLEQGAGRRGQLTRRPGGQLTRRPDGHTPLETKKNPARQGMTCQ